jgi:hypothetical protein
MPDIKYVGHKDRKVDNVAWTGLTWTPGQVHTVANVETCQKLLKHSDCWALDDTAEREAEARLLAEQAAAAAAAQAEAERVEAGRMAAEAAEAAKQEEARRAEQEAAERAAAKVSDVVDEPRAVDPEDMTREQLMDALTARGIEFHPNTGDKKLRAKLIEGA